MAPFLRISFNSYELGSLKDVDEASQPFCAVKMKEALSTGRARGWTPPICSHWQQGVASGAGNSEPGGGGSGRNRVLFS